MSSNSFEESKCPTCGQMTLEPPKLERQRAGAGTDTEVSDCEVVNGFCKAFSALAMKIPPSVCAKVTAKLDRCGIDPAAESDDVKAVLEAAVAAYEKKREAARVSSAKRRAAKKEAKAAGTSADGTSAEPVTE
jgi:cell division septation protein DedD